jgi:hypothetical protein
MRPSRDDDRYEDQNEGGFPPHGAFGFGLALGTWYQLQLTGFRDSPFPQEEQITDFLRFFHTADILPGQIEEMIAGAGMTPAFLTQLLLEREPVLDGALLSSLNLSRRFGSSSRREWREVSLRFLFFLGLLASGLQLPERPEVSMRHVA